ncbi:fumarylacetoacetate hydrolase family protein [Streptomyces endophyticus]|uniref:Fumarylacetoacetate hydrolase family protein n=1 Tax=Streptomyces endophyticus TaxID=714166 RepID=A0ABU6F2E1_9ACTN|nr:fumarylacetoacetate hydrolase family protein [Streptomyces endophyticus]MEB8338168.1 fumarylacetoacetate hydrolase family protein [Streptomyces endophyticus]
MTHIVRFADENGTVRTGVADAAGTVRAFAGERRIADLLRLPLDELRALVDGPTEAVGPVLLLPPMDGLMELWAAGVTYERSRDARVEESTEQSVYERVYDAERPELFFKSQPWRVVTDGEPIAVRDDSELNVPEPELGLVLNRHGQTAGYVVVDDVSSRSIEGENPLYLPQAKIYAGASAVSAGIVPAWEVADASALKISMLVRRDGDVTFEGTTTTAAFHRPLQDLVDHLWHCQPFPDGAVLSTGTGIVPGLDVTLADGDTVAIAIDGVGTLTNPVRAGQAGLDWLVAALDDPRVRRAHRVTASLGDADTR